MADHKHHRHHHRGEHAHGGNGESRPEQGEEQRPNGRANGHAGEGASPPADEPQAPPRAEAPEQPRGDDADATRDKYLRLAAEFENYRKRVERERAELWVRAQAELAQRLLEPVDDLQRIAHFDPATTSAAALHEGAEMVEKKLLRALEAAGLELIDADGKTFDPTQHEALTTVPAANEGEDDTVAQVYRKGYRFKGVLLRPAQVVVKKHG